jgi:fatty-acyl-CoA synthase
MAAFEMLPDVPFDPDGFAQFLEAQPDLGTKWAPSFIVATVSFPQTASGKVTKETLRAQGWWATDDPVFWRPPATGGRAGPHRYVPLSADDRRELVSQFEHHGRQDLIEA